MIKKMVLHNIALFLATLFPVMYACQSAAAFTLVKDGLPVCYIAIHPDAVPGERFAASELADHLKRITGAEVPIRETEYKKIPSAGKTILIGSGDWLGDRRFSDSANDLTMLGEQGFVIRSYENASPNVLLLAGGTPRGTVYAVYQFLHQLGVRWYASDILHVPSMKTIDVDSLSITDLPCFELRDVTVPEPDSSPLWKARLRLNTGIGYLERECGMAPFFAPIVCSINDLLPIILFDDNPEIFPLIDGVRVFSQESRCLSDPETVFIAADSLIARSDRIKGVNAAIIEFGNPDALCSCAACRKVRSSGKAESAIPLAWAAHVAERVSKKKPGFRLIIRLDGVYEKPPSGVRPSNNVVVALYPDSVDQRRPYEESIDERTMEFAAHLTAWRALNARVIVLHPSGNHIVPPAPYPDFTQIFGDTSMYHYNFVEGCLFQFPDTPGLCVSFAGLRTWIYSELLWDRYQNGDLLVREWMKGVYGKAWGPMHDYWKHNRKIAEKQNSRITAESGPFDYITDKWLSEGDRMLQRAYAMSLTDSIARNHVRRERFCFRTIQLLRVMQSPPSNKEQYKAIASTWLEDASSLGYTHVTATETCQAFAGKVRAALK